MPDRMPDRMSEKKVRKNVRQVCYVLQTCLTGGVLTCLRMFVCLAPVAKWLISSCLSKPVESFEFPSQGPLTCLYPVWQTDMHNDLPGETNDWDSWLGQSAVTKASDERCVNKLFWNVMVGITRSKVIFWPWIFRRATYDLKTIFRIGSKDDADDNWLGSYLVCVFPLDKTKYILYHGKKNEHYSFHSFKSFQSEPTIPNGFLACFHVVPRVLLWFCK